MSGQHKLTWGGGGVVSLKRERVCVCVCICSLLLGNPNFNNQIFLSTSGLGNFKLVRVGSV